MREDFQHLTRNPFGRGFVIDPVESSCIKDIDSKEGIVTVYFASFGNVDSMRDIIEEGAFAKTIAERGPKGADRIQHLLNHDWSKRIGRIQELREDGHGLLAVSKLMKEHSVSRDALIEYESGVLREHSIGFDIIKFERDEELDGLRLTELKLWEGSGVTWGANPRTPTIDVKALREDSYLFEHMVLQLRAMENAVKRGLTDERAQHFEQQIEDFKRSFRLLENALQQSEPDTGSTAPAEKPPTKDEIKLEILNQLKIN